jgi:hypothetical protein
VVGRLAHIASDDEAKCLDRNRLLVLPVDDRGQQVVHMSRDEFQRVTFQEGDLVRYTLRMVGNDWTAPDIQSSTEI